MSTPEIYWRLISVVVQKKSVATPKRTGIATLFTEDVIS